MSTVNMDKLVKLSTPVKDNEHDFDKTPFNLIWTLPKNVISQISGSNNLFLRDDQTFFLNLAEFH